MKHWQIILVFQNTPDGRNDRSTFLASPTNAPHSTDNHLDLPSFTIHHMVVIISLIHEGMFTHYFEYISAIVNIILWALKLIFSHHRTRHFTMQLSNCHAFVNPPAVKLLAVNQPVVE